MAFGSRAGEYGEERLVPRTYALEELPWEQVAGRLEELTISILRFDARWKPPACLVWLAVAL